MTRRTRIAAVPLTLLLPVLASQVGNTQAVSKPSHAAARSATKTGSAQDPADDTYFYFGDVVPPDLRSATVRLSAATGISLTTRFSPSTFSAASTAVHFTFYSKAPSDPSECGDYLVNFNGAGAPKGEVLVRKRTHGTDYQDVGKGAVKVITDGLQLDVPAKPFGEDLSGLTHWHVVVAIRLRDDAESRILDYLPDTSLPAATLEP